MFYLHYEIARQIVEERRALADKYRFSAREDVVLASPAVDEHAEAEVIELAFGAHCESDQIGA